MSEPLRHTVLKTISNEMEAAPRFDATAGSPAFFKTVRRGRISATCEKPALLLFRDSWDTEQRGTDDKIRHVMRLVLAIFVQNTAQDADVAGEELEAAIATVESVMEQNQTIRRIARITPLGGVDGITQAGWPTADAILFYEVSFERKRGNP